MEQDSRKIWQAFAINIDRLVTNVKILAEKITVIEQIVAILTRAGSIPRQTRQLPRAPKYTGAPKNVDHLTLLHCLQQQQSCQIPNTVTFYL